MTHFASYTDLTGYMDRLGLFHMDLTLDRMERFWQARGMPSVRVVHVVGTNGKGSTSVFFGSIARAHGFKTGLFTSPHFVTPRERVQVNRVMQSREDWVDAANEIMATPGGDELTYFEFQTSLAMIVFERENVDLAIMEAGLGGRFDATNVFRPLLTIFTPIGMDHEAVLGSTLRDIAADKAGAMRQGGVAITGPQEAEAMTVLQDTAQAVGARLNYSVDLADPVEAYPLGLSGLHQTVNGRLALAAWRWHAADIGLKSDLTCEQFGLETAFLPGRMQRVTVDGQHVLLDGAHNVPALEALRASLAAADIRPAAVVYACLKDKDTQPMAELVRSLSDGPILVPSMDNERAADSAVLAQQIGNGAEAVPSMRDALDRARDLGGPLLVCGSLYLLGEFYSLYPECLTP